MACHNSIPSAGIKVIPFALLKETLLLRLAVPPPVLFVAATILTSLEAEENSRSCVTRNDPALLLKLTPFEFWKTNV